MRFHTDSDCVVRICIMVKVYSVLTAKGLYKSGIYFSEMMTGFGNLN